MLINNRTRTPGPRPQRPVSGDGGFTLIELIAAIAVMVTVVGVLLPAVQRVREASNRAQAANFLRELTLVMQDFRRVNGEFPTTWVKVLEIGKAPAGGAVSGFQLIPEKLTPNELLITAEPLAGITGSDTLRLRVAPTVEESFLQSTPTAGADDARSRMLARLFHFVSQEITALVYLLPASHQEELFATMVPSLKQSTDSPDVLAALESLTVEGVFSPASFFTKGHDVALADASLRERFSSLVDGAHSILRMGTHNEQPQGGVLLRNAMPGGDKLAAVMYSFGALYDLTAGFLSGDRARKAGLAADQIERELLQLLAQAADADRRGDAIQKGRLLAQYIALVYKVEGVLISTVQADTLAGIARTL